MLCVSFIYSDVFQLEQKNDKTGIITKFTTKELGTHRLKLGRKYGKVLYFFCKDKLCLSDGDFPDLLTIKDEDVADTLQRCIDISGKKEVKGIKDMNWNKLKKKTGDYFGSKGLFKWNDNYGKKADLLNFFNGLEGFLYLKGWDKS